MPHKFVPRRGLPRKEQPPADQPVPEQGEEPEQPPDETPKAGPFKPRSAKDSLLKKLPGRGARKGATGPEPRRKLAVEPAPRLRPRSGLPMFGLIALALIAFAAVAGGIAFLLLGQTSGYRSVVAVSAGTRLDWTFVETKKSLDKAPPAYSYFDSTKVRYELYVPPEYDAGKSYPFVLFIPSETRPNGWSAWQKVCRDQGIIFASPHNCGDDRPLWERSRSALDVFDEVRRQYNTDPDRTYLAGSGGGARVACRLGFSLPEVCGGIVALGSCDLLRDEPWLRRRVVDRLNVALVASNAETSKAELERFFGPLLEKLTIRSRVWVEPGMSKNLPEAERLSDIYQWLETGVAQRRDLAARYPGSRMPGNAAWSRPEWSAALLAEAKLRLEKPETVLSGIGQLAGVKDRWSDVPAGLEALGLFQDYYQHKRELVQEEARERLGQDSVLARSLTAYLTGTADRLELARSEWQWERYLQWIQLASDLWNRIEIQGGNSDEAKAALEKLDEVRRGPRPAPTP